MLGMATDHGRSYLTILSESPLRVVLHCMGTRCSSHIMPLYAVNGSQVLSMASFYDCTHCGINRLLPE